MLDRRDLVRGTVPSSSADLARVYCPKQIEAGFPRAKILSRPHLERV
jgi:hypothetical protein